jgi:hypothetical protein
MTKHPRLLWITALALGWLFDFLFWKQPFGANFAIYSVACVLGGILVLRANQQNLARGSLVLLPLILVFALVPVFRAEPLTLFLGVLFTLLLLLLLCSSFLGGRWIQYGFADYLSSALKVAGSMIARPLGFAADVRKEQAEPGASGRKLKLWPFVRGILIALPILAIFASLLASADAMFGSELDAVLKFFAIQNLPQYIFRTAYILIGAYMLVGVILHASAQSRDEKLIGEEKATVPPFLGFTEATIVLGGVTLLFAAFVAIQFRYFFGGQANINVAGFTYAEYARRGFGELVTVAFFSLLLILGLESITRRESKPQRRTFSILGVAIVGLIMIMLVSAYQRLLLYEEAYGFSRVRTYTHAALIWIGLLLVAVIVLEILQRARLFAAAALVASLGFALTLAMLNVDAFIATQNVHRATQGHELDVPYLVSLSPDSVPVLVEAYRSPSTPAATRDAVGAALYCRPNHIKNAASGDIRAFTYSRWQADLAYSSIQGQLTGYQVIDDTWPTTVKSPAGASYECYGGIMD